MSDASSTRLLLVLHAHLPYVLGHGTWPHGEEWLWEAAAECYLPLIELLRRRRERGRRRRVLTLGVTPVLAEMLVDDRFAPGFVAWLRRKEDAAEEDARAFGRQGERELERLARSWRAWFERRRAQFEALDAGLVGALAGLRDDGLLELIGGPATHPFSPLLSGEAALRLQYATGRRSHRRLFGRDPVGAWLPECAYRPAGIHHDGLGETVRHARGIESVLQDHGLRYAFVESHLGLRGGLLPGSPPTPDARPRTRASIPLAVETSPMLAAPWSDPVRVGEDCCLFARDPFCSAQVWSNVVGYPGHPAHLEFHKRHHPGGHRYWSITDRHADLGAKRAYRPELARAVAREQADRFVRGVLARVDAAGRRGAVVCAPFDAELFGHWWAEGPVWLEQLLDRLDQHPGLVASTPSAELESLVRKPIAPVPAGSWGEGGDDRVWRGRHADRFWTAIRDAEHRARRSGSCPPRSELERRLRAQAARSLLLLQASDWPFLVYREQAADYAAARIEGHAEDFHRLQDSIERSAAGGELGSDALATLERLERRDRLFADLRPEELLPR